MKPNSTTMSQINRPIKLQCPLCCEDAFGSYERLKEHLLSITENLFCTACSKRFDDLKKMIEHIGNHCKDPEPEENDENVAPESSLLAKALLEDNNPKTELIEVEETVELFHCSVCDVNFTDIDVHLRQFHQGQKVVLEDGGHQTERTISPPPLSLISPKRTRASSDATSPQTNGPKMTKQYVIRNGKPVPVEDDVSVTDDNTAKAGGDSDLIVMHQCSVCRVHFITQTEFNMHICHLPANSDDGKKSSKGGKEEVKCIPALAKHTVNCTECKSVFTSQKELKLHLKVHRELDKMAAEKEGPHVCSYCNTEFNSAKSLRLHIRMHDPVKQKEIEPPVNYGITGEINYAIATTARSTFECTECGKSYDEEYRDVHMRSHADAASGEHNVHHCDVCNKRFATQQFLDMHMAAHNDAKRFICAYCKKAFLTMILLNAHTSAGCLERPYECRYCGRRFARPHEKVKHERIHTGEKPHVCAVCGKAFRVGYCLTLHMRTHSGSRPYQCPHCMKRFKAHSVFTHHLHTHSSERKYKCPFCPKAFKTSVQLAGHKNCHTKPFNCSVCNRPFASLYAVKTHMETHKKANNLNHCCQYCGASYARAFALRDHIKDLHPTETTDPDTDSYDPNDGQITSDQLMEIETTTVDHIDEVEEDIEEEEEEEVEEGLNYLAMGVEDQEEADAKMIVPDASHIMILPGQEDGEEQEQEEVLCT